MPTKEIGPAKAVTQADRILDKRMGGAVFCLFCDLIARTVFAPTELSISSVTAVFGAPVVIYIMIRRQKRN